MKVCVFTLGCKVNKYESGVLMKTLSENGAEVTDKLEAADYYIVNTCAVTAEAERKSRQCISRIKKLNPDAEILICGCASENDASQFLKEGVTYISGTARKDLLARLDVKGVNVLEIGKTYEENGFAESCRTRSYIKIQDGCNNFCSYCLIPYVRGRSRSRRLSDIIAEMRTAQAVSKEIVLTGIDISSYGRDIGLNLTALIESLADFDVRLRLGSFEVNIIDDGLLSALKNLKRFCPHFHLSLQSGSDEVLKAMNRRYTTSEYLEKVNLIRKYFPTAGLTTDVIAGFPAETDDEFEKCAEFIKSAGFSDIHCFPYSRRKGTAAYKLKPIDAQTVDKRLKRLLELKQDIKRRFIAANLNTPHEVLFEDREKGFSVGYTENYIKFYGEDYDCNTVQKVVAEDIFKDGMR